MIFLHFLVVSYFCRFLNAEGGDEFVGDFVVLAGLAPALDLVFGDLFDDDGEVVFFSFAGPD